MVLMSWILVPESLRIDRIRLYVCMFIVLQFLTVLVLYIVQCTMYVVQCPELQHIYCSCHSGTRQYICLKSQSHQCHGTVGGYSLILKKGFNFFKCVGLYNFFF